MLTLIFLFYQQLSFRARLIAGISVLATIMLIVGGFIIYYEVLKGFHRYTNNETVFYLELDIKKNDNLYGSLIINRLLNDFNLMELNQDLLVDKLSLNCDSIDRLFNCQLTFKVNDPILVNKFLTDKEINFLRLSKNIFTVGKNLNNIKKNHNPLIYLKYKVWFNNPAILVITEKPTNLFSQPEKLLKLLDKNTKLIGTTSNNKLKFRLVGINSFWNKNNQEQFDNLNNYSLVFNFSGQVNWLPKLFDSFNFKEEEIKKIQNLNSLKSDLMVIFKKKEAITESITDYDFFIKLETQINEDNQEDIKKILISVFGLFNPAKENKNLKDGTRLILLKRNNQTEIKAQDDLNFVELPGNQRVFIEIDENHLILTNQFYFQEDNTLPKNYTFIELKSLPSNNLFNYFLTDFKSLEVINNQIIIK